MCTLYYICSMNYITSGGSAIEPAYGGVFLPHIHLIDPGWPRSNTVLFIESWQNYFLFHWSYNYFIFIFLAWKGVGLSVQFFHNKFWFFVNYSHHSEPVLRVELLMSHFGHALFFITNAICDVISDHKETRHKGKNWLIHGSVLYLTDGSLPLLPLYDYVHSSMIL